MLDPTWRSRVASLALLGLKSMPSLVLVAVLGGLVEEGTVLLVRNLGERQRLARQVNRAGTVHQPALAALPPPAPPNPGEGEWVAIRGDKIDVFVLTQEYRWELGTTNVKTPGGAIAAMDRKLGALLTQGGGRYHDLIAVGTASCEGNDIRESDRAADRAHELVRWLRDALQGIDDRTDRNLYRLRLGRFRSCEGSMRRDTADQRRVILVAVKQRLAALDLPRLRELLLAELDDPGRLPLGFPVSAYSEFVLEGATVLPPSGQDDPRT